MEIDWYVGQEVWIVPLDKRDKPYGAKIDKIARKWITLDPEWIGQISKEDGHLKPQRGYSSSARAWPSREEYERWATRDQKWRDFVRVMMFATLPEHMTDDDLDAVIRLVKGKGESDDDS